MDNNERERYASEYENYPLDEDDVIFYPPIGYVYTTEKIKVWLITINMLLKNENISSCARQSLEFLKAEMEEFVK